MPVPGQVAAHDRVAIAAVYSVILAAVSLWIAFPYYAPGLPSLWQALGPFGNGIAGGAVAGSVAIAVFRIGRRAESREKKLVPARALVAELNRAHDIVQFGRSVLSSALPDDEEADDAPDAVRLASIARSAIGRRHREEAGRGPLLRPPPDIPRRVYEGLVSSGGIFNLEPDLQLRLHAFYEYVERGDCEAVDQLLLPLVEELARFRDVNAPFAWSDLAWPPRCAMFGLRRWCQSRRKTRSRAGRETETMTGAPSG